MKYILFTALVSVTLGINVQYAIAKEVCLAEAGRGCTAPLTCQNIDPTTGDGECLPDPNPPKPAASAEAQPTPGTKVVPVPTPPSSKSGVFVPLAPIDGLTKEGVVNSGTLTDFLRNLYRFLVGIAATLAVIMIVIGGIQYSTQDIPGAKSDGKQKIWNALFGLLLVLSPVLVFSLINPAILGLSIPMDPLDTKSRPLAPSSISNPTQTQGTGVVDWQTGSCPGGDCSTSIRNCLSSSGMTSSSKAEVTCQRQDKSLNPGGLKNARIDSVDSAGKDSYSCPAGETVLVTCTLENATFFP